MKNIHIYGTSVISQIGAYHYIESNNLFEKNEQVTIHGSSAGGLVAYLIAIGYGASDLIAYFSDNLGVCDLNYENWKEHIELLTLDKLGYYPDITELAPKLVIYYYDLEQHQTIAVNSGKINEILEKTLETGHLVFNWKIDENDLIIRASTRDTMEYIIHRQMPGYTVGEDSNIGLIGRGRLLDMFSNGFDEMQSNYSTSQ